MFQNAEHVINEGYSFYTDIHKNLTILHKAKKAQLLNTLKQYAIHFTPKTEPDMLINKKLNFIYDLLINLKQDNLSPRRNKSW